MKNRWQYIRDKLHIPSLSVILHFFAVEIILSLIWFGLSKLISIVFVREIGYLVIFVAAIFAVAWYLPKLSPSLASFGLVRQKKQQTLPRPFLIYDNVRWEDGGNDGWGYINVIGPLCPNDYTPLALKRREKVDTSINYEVVISDSDYHSKLLCLQCKTEYTLTHKPKQLSDSHNEVRLLFDGIRRRKTNTTV